MASRAGVSHPSNVHFTIRIPGPLLVALLLVLTGWFVFHQYRAGGTAYAPPARAEVFRERVDGNVWSADALIESHDSIPRPLEGWSLGTDSGVSVPVAVSSGTSPNPYLRRLVVHLFARLPEGSRTRGLQHEGYWIVSQGPDGTGIPVTQR